MVPSTFDLKTQTQMAYPQAIQSLGGWDFVNGPQFHRVLMHLFSSQMMAPMQLKVTLM